MQLGSVARLQSTGGESVSRLAVLVPGGRPIVWTPPMKYVWRRGQVPNGLWMPFKSLAKDVSHWIVVPVLVSGGELLVTMLPSPPKGPSDL